SGPRAPRGPSKAGGCDRLHGGLRGLGAARGLAVPRARAGRPRQEAIPIRGLRIGRGGDQPTSSPPARQLVAGQRPPGLPAEPTPYHIVRMRRSRRFGRIYFRRGAKLQIASTRSPTGYFPELPMMTHAWIPVSFLRQDDGGGVSRDREP